MKLKGSIPVINIYRLEISKNIEIKFGFEALTPNRTYIFKAGSNEEIISWIEAIQSWSGIGV